MAPAQLGQKRKPDVCVSVDGFLATSTHSKHGVIPAARPGAAEFTKRLAKFAHVILYSSRCHFDQDPDRPSDAQLEAACRPLAEWCEENNIWYDGIWAGQGKPDADLFIGPKMIATALNPTHDDFIQTEREIHERLAK